MQYKAEKKKEEEKKKKKKKKEPNLTALFFHWKTM